MRQEWDRKQALGIDNECNAIIVLNSVCGVNSAYFLVFHFGLSFCYRGSLYIAEGINRELVSS